MTYIQTFTGKRFYPLAPWQSEIDIEDIAHALSMQCRFAGHCQRFYSVAEHSVLLARYVSPPNKLWALLHDASEAYLVDVPSPVKPLLIGYAQAEHMLQKAIARTFGLPVEIPQEVHDADKRIVVDEMRQNMAVDMSHGEPLGIDLEYWAPAQAQWKFTHMFDCLADAHAQAA
jgi:uncharacterized protein